MKEGNDVTIYRCEPEKIDRQLYEAFKKSVSRETRERTARMCRDQDRMATIAGEGMIRFLIAGKTGEKPEEIPILRTETGKPYSPGHPYFSISHSAGAVAVCLAEREVGLDIEKLREAPFRTMRRFCTPEEEDYILSAGNEEEKRRRFFTVWTLKEAYFKCTGEGLTGGLQSVSFPIQNGKASCSAQGFAVGFKQYGNFLVAAAVRDEQEDECTIQISNSEQAILK